MIGRRVLSGIAATIVVTGITLTVPSSKAWAVGELESTKTKSGRINSSESTLIPVGGNRTRLGNRYTFQAQASDQIEINAIREEGSSLDHILIVVDPNGRSSAIIDNDFDGGRRETSTQRATSSGTWTVYVASFNGSPGSYNVTLVLKDSIGRVKLPELPIAFADQVMKKFNLPTVVCGSPELAVFTIGTETRCSTGYPKGRYVYDVATKKITSEKSPDTLGDPNLVLLKSWGLAPVSCGSSVVSIAMGAAKYCTNPANWLTAGEYTYDSATNRLTSISPPAQNSSSGSPLDSNNSGQNSSF